MHCAQCVDSLCSCAAIWVTAPLHPGPASETDNAGAVGNQCNLGFLAIVVILIVWNVHYFTRTFWFLQTLTKTDIMAGLFTNLFANESIYGKSVPIVRAPTCDEYFARKISLWDHRR